MTGNAENAIAALNSVYLRDFPLGAAKDVEAMPPSEVAKALAGHSVPTLASLMESLAPDIAASLLGFLEDGIATAVLSSNSPNAALTILNHVSIRRPALSSGNDMRSENSRCSAGSISAIRL